MSVRTVEHGMGDELGGFRGDSDETVAFAGDGLEKAWLVGILAKNLADFANGGIDTGLGVDKDIFPPKAVDDFLAGDDLSFFSEQQDQQLHGDAFNFQDVRVALELEGKWVQLEVSEAVDEGGHERSLKVR